MTEPMKVARLTDRKFNTVLTDPRYIVQEKIQGNHMTMTFNMDRPNSIMTRGGFEKQNWIPELRDLEVFGLDNVEVAGEIYHPEIKVEQLAGFLNRNEYPIPEHIRRGLRFYIFDILTWNGGSCITFPFRERQEMLLDLRRIFEEASHMIKIVPSFHFSGDKTAILKHFHKIIERGGEGIVLKNMYSLYHPGKRPENVWYKMKKTVTHDFVVMGFKPGEGKYLGMIGSIMCGGWKGGELIHVCNASGMTDAERQDMTDNHDSWLGRVVEVSGFENTDGSVKEPQFVRPRDDKPSRECELEVEE